MLRETNSEHSAGNNAPLAKSPVDVWVVLLAAGCYLMFIVSMVYIVWDHINPIEWTAGGWAAIGAWVGGSATAGALFAALRQTGKTEKIAAKQLKASRELHDRELLEQRRLRQVEAIAVIWDRIGESVGPTTELKLRLERLKDLRQRASDATDQGKKAELEQARDEHTLALGDWFPHYQASATRPLLAFSSAHMLIDDRDIILLLRDLELAFVDLGKAAATTVANCVGQNRFDYTRLDDAKSKVLNLREPMITTVAEKLGNPALKAVRGESHSPSTNPQHPEP